MSEERCLSANRLGRTEKTVFSFLTNKKALGETLILSDVGGLVGTSRVPSRAYRKIPAKG